MKRLDVGRCFVVAALLLVAQVGAQGGVSERFGAATPEAAPQIRTPAESRRGEDQTFLTFPEWYLVYSPAEYATFVRTHAPSEFPYWGHVSQLWSSYGAVIDATRPYPFNAEYHVMVLVIGISTTVEYALRSLYETWVGRVGELFAPEGGTEEDHYAARVAQEYVDFIRVRPWYEFDFVARLRGLWCDTALLGPGVLRKWERKYALTTEYGVKAVYGWLLGLGTQSAYGAASPQTVVVLDHPPPPHEQIKTLQVLEEGQWLGELPRYDAFKLHALTLADAGRTFIEIAGNGPSASLLVSVIAPLEWRAPEGPHRLFEQPITTQPGRKRVALVCTVHTLAPVLRQLNAAGVELEHVYDY